MTSHYRSAQTTVLAILVSVTAAILVNGLSYGATERISTALAEKIQTIPDDQNVTFLIELDSKADLSDVYGDRTAVIERLQTQAATTQSALLNYLRSVESDNEVVVVKRFWISNRIIVRTSKRVLNRASERMDVKMLTDGSSTYEVLQCQYEPVEGSCCNRSNTCLAGNGWNILDIRMPEVRNEYGLSGNGVVIGFVDWGVDPNHPEYSGKLITNDPNDPTYPGGWAEFDKDGNQIEGIEPHDDWGYGTHHAGTAVGGPNIGVAPGARFMHANVISLTEGIDGDAVVAGIEWLVDPDGDPLTKDGCDVLCVPMWLVTWSCDAVSGSYFKDPIEAVLAMGILPVAAAGDLGWEADDNPPHYVPESISSLGNLEAVFSVGAVEGNSIWHCSSRGPVSPYVGEDYTKPDIVAPGYCIYSSLPGDTYGKVGAYEGCEMSSTNHAAVHVAGAAAILLEICPHLTGEELKIILETAAAEGIDYGDPGKDNAYGSGRLDVYRAVTSTVPSISGHVKDVFGVGISGVRVQLFNDFDMTFPLQEVVTDPQGFYEFDMPPHCWTGIIAPRTGEVCYFNQSEIQFPHLWGEAVADFVGYRCDLKAYARKWWDGSEWPMPEYAAQGCPAGLACSHGVQDQIIVYLTLPGQEIQAEDIAVTKFEGSFAEVFESVTADGDITAPDYQTTITISEYGGCGVDELEVSVNGLRVGIVDINVRGFDTGNPNGAVDNIDLSYFSQHYTSPPKEYSECYDYVSIAPGEYLPDGLIELTDFGEWSKHWNHRAAVLPPASSPLNTTGASVSFSVEQARAKNHVVIVVELDNAPGATSTVCAMKYDKTYLDFVGWEPAQQFAGNVLVSDIQDRDGSRIVIAGIVNGIVSSEQPVVELHFELKQGEIQPDIIDRIGFWHGEYMDGTGHQFVLKGGEIEQRTPELLRFGLKQNHPNPFNPTTRIQYSIADQADVNLSVYDVRGQLIRTLVDENKMPNRYTVEWNGKDNNGSQVASGIYWYRMTAGSFTQTRKMVFLK